MAEPTPLDRRRPERLLPILQPHRVRLGAGMPASLTGFVGRAREIAEVGALLRRPEVRLVTLTGPGGVGKTRLAMRTAAEVAATFPGGIAFVPLAPVTAPELIASAIFGALGERAGGERFTPDRLHRLLGERRVLLVLDNMEHLEAGAGPIADLLSACPRLTILATSRAVLRLSGEHEFPVPPLVLPDPTAVASADEALRADAVHLFVQRALAAQPRFVLTPDNASAVAAICQRLDGLPLAIELAAARVGHLSPVAIAARLDRPGAARLPLLTGGPRDAPIRHQTMHQAIAWSYDLLNDAERVLFGRLAVFAGGFTIEAAAAVCEADEWALLDGIGSLIAKSLLRREEGPDGDPRFGMLEMIREFGLGQLTATGEETAVRQRHAEWCLAFADRAGPDVDPREDDAWLDRLDRDHPNLRLALAWLVDRGDGPGATRLAGALASVWEAHAQYGEGRRWLEAALALDGEAPPPDRLRALSGAGTMAWYQGDFAQAIDRHEQALAVAREIGDRSAEAFALNNLGAQALEVEDFDSAVALLEESLAVARTAGESRPVLFALHNLGQIERLRGAADAAAARIEESLMLARQLGETFLIPSVLTALGHTMLDLGDRDRSLVLFQESLGFGRAQGNVGHIIDALEGLARLGGSTGHAEPAARLFGATTALRAETGTPRSPSDLAYFEPTLDELRCLLGAKAFGAVWAAGQALPREEAIAAGVALAAMSAPRSARSLGGPATTAHGLTERELEVLRRLAAGDSNREIGSRLFISPATAARHVANILAKLGVDSRAKATVYARRHGLG